MVKLKSASNEKDGWMKLALERENEIKKLKESNK